MSNKALSQMTDEELMATDNRQRIYILKARLRHAKSVEIAKYASETLLRIERLRIKKVRSVQKIEARIKTHAIKIAKMRAEKIRQREIEAELRAGVRKAKLLRKHFDDRTNFRHTVTTMAEAKPGAIYRFHHGLCCWVKLERTIIKYFGAPINLDMRRPAFRMHDCQVFINDAWQTIPIRGVNGELAYRPAAPPSEKVSLPEAASGRSVDLSTAAIKFGPDTTFEELMSGRVVVDSLYERMWRNDLLIQRRGEDGFFHASASGGDDWHLIPGQSTANAGIAEPPKPLPSIDDQQHPRIYFGHEDYETEPSGHPFVYHESPDDPRPEVDVPREMTPAELFDRIEYLRAKIDRPKREENETN